jgi:hypothetical protein
MSAQIGRVIDLATYPFPSRRPVFNGTIHPSMTVGCIDNLDTGRMQIPVNPLGIFHEVDHGSGWELQPVDRPESERVPVTLHPTIALLNAIRARRRAALGDGGVA